MKKYLERLAFTTMLGALILAGWFALETEASSPARPALVEVAAAPPVEAAAADPAPGVSIVTPEAASAVVTAPITVPESQSLFRTLPPTPSVDVAAAVAPSGPDAATEQVAAAPVVEGADEQVAAAPVVEGADEQVATTSADAETDEAIVVEHTIAAIPNPPDVGASDRRESFEVEADPDAHDPWLGVRNCESHNNYAINTGNGFYGAYQFTISSWDWVAGLIGRPDLIGVRPDLAAPWDQDRLAQALAFEVAGGGLQHWPVCGRFYG